MEKEPPHFQLLTAPLTSSSQLSCPLNVKDCLDSLSFSSPLLQAEDILGLPSKTKAEL